LKRKVLSLFMTLVLVLTACLATALPAVADTSSSQEAAVLAAADRLASEQHPDGGFEWYVGDAGGPNIIGITAIGILKGWELDSKPTYDSALALTYMYLVNNPPSYNWNGTKWTESIHTGDPDIYFLVWLGQAAASDADLLTAIDDKVSGTNPEEIIELAKARWDDKVLHLGSTSDEADGTAATYAQWLRDYRTGGAGIIPWQLNLAVQASLALDNCYATGGYDVQAVVFADAIAASITVGDFDPDETAQDDYVIGLTGAIQAYEDTGTHQGDVASLLINLLAVQDTDGYWNYHDDDPGDVDTMSVQTTSYAVMALSKEGSADALAAANEAADWLVSNQKPDGGWNAENGAAGDECFEVDSESALALAIMAAGSSSVGMTASYIPPATEIGILVTPTSVNFGNLTPGTPSAPQTVTVTNTGNVVEDFSASLTNISTPDVYSTGLKLDTVTVGSYGALGVAVGSNDAPDLVLTIPSGTTSGTYTATLVFWAEEAD